MQLPLPDELVEQTFSYLDGLSLLRCMQVCKLFYSIIRGSTLICYKIELFASYMEDNEHSSLDVTTRLKCLREYNRVWNNLNWTSSGVVPMRAGRCWEFSGGILAQSTDENDVFFVQLPSRVKGIVERRWSVPFDFSIRDFTLDTSQDLIVLLELVDNLPNITCKLYMQTLSGKQHPRTLAPQLTHTLESLHSEFTFLMQICGDRFAILLLDLQNHPPRNHFVVWNWRTGDQKVHISTPGFESFAFMTEDLILAGITKSRREPALRVLSIAACVDPIHSLKDMPYICDLQYPDLLESTEYFLIRSDPSPAWKPPACSGVPFYCSRKDTIFTVAMQNSSEHAYENTVLFVPSSTLLLEVERSHNIPCRNVAWRNWGPSGTRMICRNTSQIWVCYTYGMKFIYGLQSGNRRTAQVYDFNPYAARKDVRSPTDLISWRALAKESKPNCRFQIFGEDVVTTLPGRVVNLILQDLGGTGWNSVMVGEDHIVMVHVRSPLVQLPGSPHGANLSVISAWQSETNKYGYMAM